MKTILSSILLILLSVLMVNAQKRHTIKQDETLESIASLYGVTPAQIKAANSQVRVFVSGVIITIPEPSPIQNETKTVNTVKTAMPQTSTTTANKNNREQAEKNYNYWLNNQFSKDKSIRRTAADALIYAAENGCPEAQYDYYKYAYSGKIYKEIKKNEEKAMKMLFLAARNDNTEAKWKICHDSGHGAIAKHPDYPDKATIDKWHEELINLGHPEALYDYAKDLLYGYRDVQKDTLKAIAIYERMTKERNPKTENPSYSYYYDRAFSELESLTRHLPAKGEEAFRIGKDYEKSGQTKLASLYYNKASKDKYLPAMTALAELYAKQKNNYMAGIWYQNAAKNGDKKAIEYVAQLNKEKESTAQKPTTSHKPANNRPIEKKDKFDRIMDKVDAVLDVLNTGLDDINKSVHAKSKRSNDNQAYFNSDKTQGSDSEKPQDIDDNMLLISPLISKLEEEKGKAISLVGEDMAKSFVRDNDKCIDWLISKRQSGQKYISKDEWDSYNEERVARINAQRERNRRNAQIVHDRYASLSKTFSLSNYSQCENTLRRYNDNPSGSGYNYETDIYDVRKWQKEMREIRAKYGCKKSKWEDWDGIPGSM